MVNRFTILKNIRDQSPQKTTWLPEDTWRRVNLHVDSWKPTDTEVLVEVKGECPEDVTAVADDTGHAQVVIIREPDTDQGQANTKYTNILYGDKGRTLQCVNMQTNNVKHIGTQFFVSQSIQYIFCF